MIPWRTLAVFFAGYLVALVHFQATASCGLVCMLQPGRLYPEREYMNKEPVVRKCRSGLSLKEMLLYAAGHASQAGRTLVHHLKDHGTWPDETSAENRYKASLDLLAEDQT